MAISPCNTTTNIHQMELLEHGSVAFPIACYADDFAQTNVPWHWHDELEYAIVTQGAAEFWLENTRIPLGTGDGIFLASRALHAAEDPDQTSAGLHSAVFHARLVGGSMDSVFWQKLVQPFWHDAAQRYVVLHADIPDDKRILDALEAAWQAVAQECDDYENLTRYHLSRALGLLSRRCVASETTRQERADSERIREMLSYIEANYGEELTVEMIAQSAAISPSVCLRCFGRTLGTTPIQYVKQLRLEKSAQMLKQTRQTVKEIAMECGFRDVSYYTKAFRQRYGLPPLACRRK